MKRKLISKYMLFCVLAVIGLSVQGYAATVAYWHLDEIPGEVNDPCFMDSVGTRHFPAELGFLAPEGCPVGNLLGDTNPRSVHSPTGQLTHAQSTPFFMGDNTTSWSFECYLRAPDNLLGVTNFIIASRQRQTNGVWPDGWDFNLETNYRLTLRILQNYPTQPVIYLRQEDVNDPNGYLVVDKWHHVGVVWDANYNDPTWGPVGKVSLYVDHVLVDEDAAYGDLNEDATENRLSIGGYVTGTPDFNSVDDRYRWRGDMDEFKWHDVAITDVNDFLPLPTIQATEMDFDCDGIVNLRDFREFALDWLESSQ